MAARLHLRSSMRCRLEVTPQCSPFCRGYSFKQLLPRKRLRKLMVCNPLKAKSRSKVLYLWYAMRAPWFYGGGGGEREAGGTPAPILQICSTCTGMIGYRQKFLEANFKGSHLNEFGSVDPLRWRVVQSPLKNAQLCGKNPLFEHTGRERAKMVKISAKKSAPS